MSGGRPPLQADSYCVYHGSGQIDDLARFGLAVVRTVNYRPEEIAALREASTRVLAYVSMGEDDEFRRGASWYRLDSVTSRPLRDERWGTYYVDIRDRDWQKRVLDAARAALRTGYDGVFLDTVDACAEYPETAPAVTPLIQALRDELGSGLLLVNRGFAVLEAMAPQVDGVVFEAFSSRYLDGAYALWLGADLAWTEAVAERLQALRRSMPLAVFALDYAGPGDAETARAAIDRARRFRFIPYVGTALLDTIGAPPPAFPSQRFA